MVKTLGHSSLLSPCVSFFYLSFSFLRVLHMDLVRLSSVFFCVSVSVLVFCRVWMSCVGGWVGLGVEGRWLGSGMRVCEKVIRLSYDEVKCCK